MLSKKYKNTVAIVQARMNSSRFPDKVLKELSGKPVLYHIVERLKRVNELDKIVIATTGRSSDKPIVDFCIDNEIDVFAYQGEEDDLLGRYIECGEVNEADIIVMVDGDCPLLHPFTIDRMISALEANKHAEYAKLDDNSIEGGVAVLRLNTYKKIKHLTNDLSHLEHATLFLMENLHLFSIVDVECDDKLKVIKHRLWLDTPSDYAFLSEIYRRLYTPGDIVNLYDVVTLLLEDAELRAINSHITQKPVSHQGKKLVVITQNLNNAYVEKAKKLIRRLIEYYYFGVEIFDHGMSDIELFQWNDMRIVKGISHNRTICLFSNNDAGIVLMPITDNGEAQLEIGLGGESVEVCAKLIAQYHGSNQTTSGYSQINVNTDQRDLLLEDSVCPLCGGSEHEKEWVHKSGVINAQCADCGHVYLSRRPVKAQIDSSYADFEQKYSDDYLLDSNNLLFQLAESRAKIVVQVLGRLPKSILEVGCAYGHFLQQFSDIKKVGIEPSIKQSSFARKKFGLNDIWQSGFEMMTERPDSWPVEGFELVCSFHVFEHIENSIAFLRFMKSHMATNGVLLLAVPNIYTLSPDFIELSFIERGLHLHSFSLEVLSWLLQKEGFELVAQGEEQSNSMLRSSTWVAARLLDNDTLCHGKVNDRGKISKSMDAFYTKLYRMIDQLEFAFKEWHLSEKKIYIYGGGVHTASLLNALPDLEHWVLGIIDDDVDKQKSNKGKIRIISFDQAMQEKPDVIIISTLASEHVIEKRLQEKVDNKITVLGIYSHFGGLN